MKRLARFPGRFYLATFLITLIVLFGFLGPVVFSGHNANDVVGGLYDHPSGKAWLGTDNIGHDVFGELMYGTRASLEIGLLAGLLSTVVGTIIGVVAGYVGGMVDEMLMGLTNVLLTIPPIVILILILVSLNTSGTLVLAIVLASTAWTWTARAVRAQASSIRVREHIDVARLSGANTFGIMSLDVLPYMLSYIFMAFVLQVAGAILAEAGLALLGLRANGVSLGIMLHWSLAFEALRTGAWWAFVPPTVLLTLIAFGLLLLQSSLDEVFNPRLRRSRKVRRLAAATLSAPAVAPDPEEVAVRS
ncbi:MAG: ABC transporter permease [Mycobacteriales bacterium]